MGDWDVTDERPIADAPDPWGVAKQRTSRPGWGELASDVGNYFKQAGQEAVRTPVEAYHSAKQDLTQASFPREQKPDEGFWEGYAKDVMDKPAQAGRLLRGAATAAGLPLAPAYGAAKSMLGRPLANVIHKTGQYINPEEAAKHTPEDIYEDVREDVGSALGVARPKTTGASGSTQTLAPRPTKTPDVAVPTQVERKSAAQAAYNHTDIKTAEIRPQSLQNLASVIEGDLVAEGYRPVSGDAAKTFKALRAMRPKVGQNAPVLINDIDATRKVIGKYSREVDAAGAPTSEAAAASRMISHIDSYLLNLQQSDLLRGNAGRIGNILGEARKDWASFKREQMVDTLEANADAARASTYGGGNANNAIRQKFRPLTMNNAAKMRGWSPEAKEAVGRVVSGGPQYSPANVSRQIGRFAPDSKLGFVLHGLTGGGLFAAGVSPAVAIPIAAATYAAKRAGIALTRRNVEKVRDILAKESALYKSRQAAAVPTSRRNMAPLIPGGYTQIPGRAPERGESSQNPYAP